MKEDYLDDLLTIPFIYSPQISPNGKYIAYSWRNINPNIDVFYVPTNGSSEPVALSNTPEMTMVRYFYPRSKAVLVGEDKSRNERVRLFRRCIFNFLIGNEDMHLKNFSLITRDSKTELSPAYDYLSTTVAFLLLGKDEREIEEIALPLKGKKRNLTGSVWIDYFGRERLGLNPKLVTGELLRFTNTFNQWTELIQNSFLSDTAKELYLKLVSNRRRILSL